MNEGGFYDPATGEFTCPVDSVYSFTWSTDILPGTEPTRFTSGLMVDGYLTSVAYSNHDNHGSQIFPGGTTSMTATVFCSAGQRVRVIMYNGGEATASIYGEYSTFMGHIVN